jgi:GST-like protein
MSSPNVRKVAIMLEEQGLEYELRHVDVFRGVSAEFLKLNPLGKAPVLVDNDRGGGRPIIESGAILMYLAETYGGFLPKEEPGRTDVIQWLMVQMGAVGPMLGQLNRFQMVAPKEASYRLQAEKLYRLLDAWLAQQEWLAGGAYSIADIATHPWAFYLEIHGFDPAAHPNLIRWRSAIDARPAVVRAAERFVKTLGPADGESFGNATDAQLDKFYMRDPNGPALDYKRMRGG